MRFSRWLVVIVLVGFWQTPLTAEIINLGTVSMVDVGPIIDPPQGERYTSGTITVPTPVSVMSGQAQSFDITWSFLMPPTFSLQPPPDINWFQIDVFLSFLTTEPFLVGPPVTISGAGSFSPSTGQALYHSTQSRIPFTDLTSVGVNLSDPTNRIEGSGSSNGPATGAHLDLVYPDLGAQVTGFSISLTQKVRVPEPSTVVLVALGMLALVFLKVRTLNA